MRDVFGNVPIDVGNVMTDECRESIDQCQWVLIGGHLPSLMKDKAIWGSTHLRILVSVTPSWARFVAPKGWHVSRHRMQHSIVGGVTDGNYHLESYTRSGVEARIEDVRVDKAPSQDLRCILKTGEEGRLSYNLTLPPSQRAANRVRYCGRGVISEDSLWPVKFPSIMIRTQWRNHSWVERRLSNFEKLLAMDVPEKLIRSVPDDTKRLLLIKAIHAPGKVLNAALAYLVRAANGDSVTNNKRKREVLLDALVFLQHEEVRVQQKGWKREDKFGDMGDVVFMSKEDRPKEGSKLEIVKEMDGEHQELIDVPATDYNDKATKSDSAEVRTGLWTGYLIEGISHNIPAEELERASDLLRGLLLRQWKRGVTKSFFRWANSIREDIELDASIIPFKDEARDCISRTSNATWWSWDEGSRPLFWRWPSDYVVQARDGVSVHFTDKVNPWTRKQRASRNKDCVLLVQDKLNTIRRKGYVESGPIVSLMSFFDVPKGTDDIRMVYDGSASGLNDFLWAPWFPLPTIDCLLRSLEPGYCMADNDVGEMFHNFMLHKDLREFCGLDFSRYFDGTNEARDDRGRLWERWNRLAMGLRTSPYCAVQGMMIAREVILGNRMDQIGNVFHWDRVRLNLPGDSQYDPSRAWVTKVRENGQVAADVFVYVDDIRCSAPTQKEAWQASQRTSSVLGFLGLQDAARKRRDPGQETGAWTGSVVWTSHDRLSIMTTQEKWDKTKRHLEWLNQNLSNKMGMDNKMLKSIRGFLVYVSRTYGSMVPYLKGLHATIDSWRGGRTSDGFKVGRDGSAIRASTRFPIQSEEDNLIWDDRFGMTEVTDTEPARVYPVPRMAKDLECLMSLTDSEKPPHRMGRMTSHARVMYGFGDASKQGFGASIELPDKSIHWRYGQWRLQEEFETNNPGMGMSLMKERSSNYRELRNLVEALESAFYEGLLDEREIFMFTDNSTAEAAFFKGTSSSELLFDLVLRLRKIEMTGRCMVHMVHVAGTRMIWQGTDGLSRGDKTSGVMAGESMLSFIPLNQSALERSPALKGWMKEQFETSNVIHEKGVKFLEPSEWPEALRGPGVYIWTPPPAAADVAAEYLAQAIHKRPATTHIFICPRLMTSYWLRIVRKASDVLFYIPIGSPIWGTNEHEPLIFAIFLPLSRDKPWRHQGTAASEHVGNILPKLFGENMSGASVVLCECIIRAWRMAGL